MELRKSKKGVVHTWFDYVFAIVGGVIIFATIFFVSSSGTASVEREIKSQTFDIKSEEILINYLSGYIIKDDKMEKLLGSDTYDVAKGLADSKMTIAEIISYLNENYDGEYRKILKAQTEYVLNGTLGSEKWKLDIIYPDGRDMSFGGFVGETKIIELKLPASGYQSINIKLTSKKEKN